MPVENLAKSSERRGIVLRPGDPTSTATVVVRDDTGRKTSQVVNAAEAAEHLRRLAARWPVGSTVRHAADPTITGAVTLDEAVHIPGVHTGGPSAWCLTATGEQVYITWHSDMAPYQVWMALDEIAHADRRDNRPRPRGPQGR